MNFAVVAVISHPLSLLPGTQGASDLAKCVKRLLV